MEKPKVGDKVICIHDKFSHNALREGMEYVVTGTNYDEPKVNNCVQLGASSTWYNVNRFKLAACEEMVAREAVIKPKHTFEGAMEVVRQMLEESSDWDEAPDPQDLLQQVLIKAFGVEVVWKATLRPRE